jgi:hypothetical protein
VGGTWQLMNRRMRSTVIAQKGHFDIKKIWTLMGGAVDIGQDAGGGGGLKQRDEQK